MRKVLNKSALAIVIALYMLAPLALMAQSFEGVIELTTVSAETGERATVNWMIKDGLHKMDMKASAEGTGSYEYTLLFSKGDANLKMLANNTIYSVPMSSLTIGKIPSGAQAVKTDVTKTIAGMKAYKLDIEVPGAKAVGWVTDEISYNADDLPAMFRDHGVFKLLRDNGISSFPLNMVATNSDGKVVFSHNVTSVKAQKLDASEFQIPAGYTPAKEATQEK